MKILKALISKAKELSQTEGEELKETLNKLIFYSPKFPLRLHQQQLLNEAESFSFNVLDEHFAKKSIKVAGYKWGNGKLKVLITHGWGSKAADFTELISALKTNADFEIFAFDASGNGSSEGELTGLLLFEKAITEIVNLFGAPDILIGHSLGVMANVMAVQNFPDKVKVMISLAPLIKLKEHFIATFNSVQVSQQAQLDFFERFSDTFKVKADTFTLSELYKPGPDTKHLLAYDVNDKISPVQYVKEFLSEHPEIKSLEYNDVGHEKMLKDTRVIEEVVRFIGSE